jgi:hypothetical protein
MSQPLSNAPGPSRSSRLAKAFSRLGWIGFWVQVVVGSIPVMLMVYVFAFARDTGTGTRGGLPLVEYLTIVSLLVAGLHHDLVLPVHAACQVDRRPAAAHV